MKASSQSVRRSADQWQALVEQFEQSGLSAMRFCQEHQLGYASFCQWRRRLTRKAGAERVMSSKPEAEFLDLSALGSTSMGGWQIVLSLGGGVELRLSRG